MRYSTLLESKDFHDHDDIVFEHTFCVFGVFNVKGTGEVEIKY